jgi:hypothetical protein
MRYGDEDTRRVQTDGFVRATSGSVVAGSTASERVELCEAPTRERLTMEARSFCVPRDTHHRQTRTHGTAKV